MRTMPSRVCWNCGKDAHQTLLSHPRPQTRGWVEGIGSQPTPGAFRCDSCGVLSIGFSGPGWEVRHVNGSTQDLDTLEELTWFPKRVEGASFPDVPEPIASVASEAFQCHSIGAYRAALMLARTVVEATAKDQGITTGTLASKINQMADSQLIRLAIKVAADEIRLIGNDMAHGDLDALVTEEDAAEILELMSVVLTEVYELPARLEARRKARIARGE